MPLLERDFSDAANKILLLLKQSKKPLSHDSFQHVLYRLLTKMHIDADVFAQEYLRHKSSFDHAQEHISLAPQGMTDSNPEWFFFKPFYEGKDYIKKASVDGFGITHKRYYSLLLPKGPAHVTVEFMITFITSLPALFQKLYKLSYDHHSQISFKVPNSMAGFLTHHDTLVVHFRKKELSNDIHEIVKEHFHKYGFLFKSRFHRVDKGFDLADNIIKQGSHSNLLALLLSDHIYKHKDRLLTVTEDQLIDWLKSCMQTINTWDESTFAKKLRSL